MQYRHGLPDTLFGDDGLQQVLIVGIRQLDRERGGKEFVFIFNQKYGDGEAQQARHAGSGENRAHCPAMFPDEVIGKKNRSDDRRYERYPKHGPAGDS